MVWPSTEVASMASTVTRAATIAVLCLCVGCVYAMCCRGALCVLNCVRTVCKCETQHSPPSPAPTLQQVPLRATHGPPESEGSRAAPSELKLLINFMKVLQ